MPQVNLRTPVDRDASPPDGVAAGLSARVVAAVHRLRPADVLFWGLLTVGLALLVAPLWAGPMPPLTDFGGHVQMADAWVRAPSDPFIAGLVERHDSWLVPNLLAVRFTALLYPALDVVSGMRLFVTLCMVGLIAGIMWVLATWRRSRWLVFLALPFTWNGMLSLGLINYAAAMALMFAAIALARRYGERGRRADAVWLGVVLLLAFWAHGLGAPITVLMAGFVLIVSATSRRRLVGLLAFVPGVVLWVRWYLESRRALGIGHEVQRTFTMQKSWDELLVNTIDVHVDGGDMAVLALIIGAWLVLLATSVREEPAEVAARPRWRSEPRAVAGWLARSVWSEAREHALLTLAMGLLLGYFFVAPAYIGTTFISPRLIVPAVLLLFLTPRVPVRGLLPKVAIAIAVFASFYFARDIARHVTAFEHEEMAPVAALAAEIPPGHRVLCAEVFRVDPIFIRAPLDHNCNGVLVARSGGFADGAFADTPYNAVVLKDTGDKVKLESNRWQSYPALTRLDYVVVRGEHRAPAADVADEVDVIAPEPWELGPRWTLYRVRHPAPVATSLEEVRGGKGGAPLVWNCPPGTALTGVVATTTPDGKLVGSVQARCRGLEVRADGVVQYAGRRETGPRFGQSVQHHRRVLECPNGQVMVGLSGASGAFIDQLGILCGEGRLVASEFDASVSQLEFAATGEERGMVGGEGGDPWALVCPEDSVPIGLRGGFGYMIDAVGVACAEGKAVLDEAVAAAAAAAVEEEEPEPEPPAPPTPAPDRRRGPPSAPPSLAPSAPSDRPPAPPTGNRRPRGGPERVITPTFDAPLLDGHRAKPRHQPPTLAPTLVPTPEGPPAPER